MSKTTQATRTLQQAGVAFTVHTYNYDPNAERVACRRQRRWAKIRRVC